MKQLLPGITALGFASAIAAQISISEPSVVKKGADMNMARGTESAVVSTHSPLRKTKEADNTEVIASRTVAPGVVTRIVKDRHGRIYRDIVRNGIATPPPQRLNPRQNGPTASASLFESFEDWNGELDWIPEGWTEINTEGNTPTEEMCLHNINNTWHGDWTGDGYWTDITKDGEKECYIHFTYNAEYTDDFGNKVEIPAAAQDEWLISPKFTVLDGQKLFFELQIDPSAIYMFDWSNHVYDRNTIASNLEVLASDDSGKTWKSLWIATEQIADTQTDDELYAQMAELKYRSISISVSEYAGKEIQVAFRYLNNPGEYGFSGNSMSVDAISVDTPTATSAYNLPSGSLLNGFTDDLIAYDAPLAIMPANTSIVWTSGANIYTENNTWNFYNHESGYHDITLEGDAVEITYPWSRGEVYPFPELRAENEFGFDIYSFGIGEENKGGTVYGGEMPKYNGHRFGMVNADYAHKYLIVPFLNDYESDETTYCFGTGREGIWGEETTQMSFGNMFAKPSAPLAVEKVMVTLGALKAEADAEFIMNIFTVDKYGTMSADPVVSATATIADAVIDEEFSNLIFTLDKTYIIDETVLVEITGFVSDKVQEFGACSQYILNDPADNTAYMKFRTPYGEELYDIWYAAGEVLQDYSNSLYIGFIGSFNVMVPEKEKVYLPKDGGSKTVRVESNIAPDKWSVSTDCDWLSAEVRQNGDDCIVTISAPVSGLESREGTVSLSVPGSEAVINVVQGTDAGIDDVTATTKPTARFVGDNILVSDVEAGSAVCIVSADGRILAKGIADCLGNATLDVSTGKGVLIVTTPQGNVRIIR